MSSGWTRWYGIRRLHDVGARGPEPVAIREKEMAKVVCVLYDDPA